MVATDTMPAVPAVTQPLNAGMASSNEVLVNVATRPGYSPEYASYFPTGSGRTRIMQYFAEFMPPGGMHTPANMLRLVRKYFVPDATLRIQLLSSVTHLTKTFDFPFAGVPYFIDGCGRHKFRSMRAHFGETEEHRIDPTMPPPPPPASYSTRVPEPLVMGNTTHIVESQQMVQISTMANGWQGQRTGMFRALLSPYTTVERVPAPPGTTSSADGTILQLETRLRVQYLCFAVLAQTQYIPLTALRYGINTITIPEDLMEEIIQYGLAREKRRNEEEPHGMKRARIQDASHEPFPTEAPPSKKREPPFTLPAQAGMLIPLDEWDTPEGLIHSLDVR